MKGLVSSFILLPSHMLNEQFVQHCCEWVAIQMWDIILRRVFVNSKLAFYAVATNKRVDCTLLICQPRVVT